MIWSVEIEPRVGPETVLHRGGKESAMSIMRILAVRDRERPGGLLEGREQLVVAPAFVAELTPSVETEPVTTNERHRVDGARTAVSLAPRHRDASIEQTGFGLGSIGPVVLRAQKRYPFPGRGHRRIAFSGVPRLEQQHTQRSDRREAVRENASSGPCTHYDVVELVVRRLGGSGRRERRRGAGDFEEVAALHNRPSCQMAGSG